MALACTIARTVVSPVTYNLKIETGVILYERSPIHIGLPLPGQNPILLDLGFIKPRMVLTGLIDEAPGTDGAITTPSKENLEDLITDSSNSAVLTVTLNGDAYVCRPTASRFEVRAAQEDRWFFTLEFALLLRT